MHIAEAKNHLFSVLTSDEGIYIGIQATANDEKKQRVFTRLKHMSYGSISKSKGPPTRDKFISVSASGFNHGCQIANGRLIKRH
jgi:hypothetical protein